MANNSELKLRVITRSANRLNVEIYIQDVEIYVQVASEPGIPKYGCLCYVSVEGIHDTINNNNKNKLKKYCNIPSYKALYYLETEKNF